MKLSNDQLRQNAAAMLAFADGKPIECQNPRGAWVQTDSLSGIETIPHRPAPWTLPAPPAGKQWGWEGQWKAEWLPEGCRPLLRGEERRAFDEFLTSYDGNRWLALSEDMEPAPDTYQPHRTRRPLPAEPVTRPWSKPEDVPLNCWVRFNNHPDAFLIIKVQANGIGFGSMFREWVHLEGLLHSTDRHTWLPCVTQEP